MRRFGGLRWRPDFTAIARDVGDTVHRLEGGMGLERKVIDCFQPPGGRSERLAGISLAADGVAVLCQGAFEGLNEPVRVKVFIRTFVPFHAESFATFEGCPGGL